VDLKTPSANHAVVTKKAQTEEDLAWSRAVRIAFGAQVRRLRKQIDLSQEQLALQSGVDRSFVGQVERGERNLSLENIHRLADGLKVSPTELLQPVEPSAGSSSALPRDSDR
jgi:transcriptional regulator with XRE-family HTH domain